MKIGFHKISKFFTLPILQKVVLCEAFLLLMIAKVIVKLVPLKKLVPHLGTLNGTAEMVSDQEMTKANEVKSAIITACTNLPWKSVCLDQALACVFMLRKRKVPYSFCLGVLKNSAEERLNAHAWVQCGGKVLVGGLRSEQFKMVASFSSLFRKK